jgi:hypothetical protein
MAAQLFFGLGVGFNERLSLTTGYRHIFMNDIDAEGQIINVDPTPPGPWGNSYNISFHVFDLNLRWIW